MYVRDMHHAWEGDTVGVEDMQYAVTCIVECIVTAVLHGEHPAPILFCYSPLMSPLMRYLTLTALQYNYVTLLKESARQRESVCMYSGIAAPKGRRPTPRR